MMKIAREVTGSGPPIVFLHGLTNSRRAWDPVIPHFSDRFACVSLDFRGHGETGAADDYSILSLVSDVRTVVEELSLDPPAIVGHSLGGTVAAVYAAAHRARAVVCVDQSLRFGDFSEIIRPFAARLQGDDCGQALLEFERGLGLGAYGETAEFERRVLTFPPEVVRGLWDAALTTPPEQLKAVSEALLPRIDAPLLSLHGSAPPDDYEQWLTRLVPAAEVEVWDGAGHMLHLVEPARFAERVARLLNDAG